MASQLSTYQIGDLVYMHYAPKQLGVVVAVSPVQHISRCKIQWGTGKHKGTFSELMNPSKYEDLVLESERKAKNHRAEFNRIQALIKKNQFP